MNWNIKVLKRAAQATLLGSSLVLGLAQTASAQDPYRYDRYNRDSVKRHQKEEKRDLKRHQRLERDEFGNSAALRRHQKEEQRDLKRHQKGEKRSFDGRDRWWRP
jgi:hypothetical protein